MLTTKPSKILTILLIHQQNRILLAMKKRGFGKGKYNGFGGKVERNKQTITQAAIRQTQQQGCITPKDTKFMGYIRMDYDCEPEVFKVHVFKATEFDGQAKETEQMKAQWFNVEEIPYAKMWIDDQYWMPMFLKGVCFNGYLSFEGHDKLLKVDFQEVSEEELIKISQKQSQISLK